jgi:hypothetical protein
MNIKQYLQSKWDFKKTTEQNVITFNNGKEKAKKARLNLIIFSVVVIALSILFHNPMLSFALMIGTLTFGSEYVWHSAADYVSTVVALDSTHIAIAYRYTSNYGYVVIGTVANGNELSFGTSYAFNATYTGYFLLDKIDSTHFVVGFNTNTGIQAVIGTVASGNQVSYGSVYTTITNGNCSCYGLSVLDSTHFVFEFITYDDYYGTYLSYCSIGVISSTNVITFGSNYQFNGNYYSAIYATTCKIDSTHFVLAYQDPANSNYGTALVGTVASGNQISYGSEYVFYSGEEIYNTIDLLDSTHFVIVFACGDPGRLACKIGTISNTTEIAFGSLYYITSGNGGSCSVKAIDSTHFVLAYQDPDNSKYGTAIIGTVANGNKVSLGTPVVFNSSDGYNHCVSMLDTTHFVNKYTDNGNSNYGTAIIGTVSFAAPAQAGFLYLMV